MANGNFRFLVTGAGRGGTSLLAGLLDFHPGLELGFEFSSIEFLMGKDLPYRGPDLFHKRVAAFISSCNQAASRYQDVLWGNKITTEQIRGLEDHNLANPESQLDVLDMFFNHYLQDQAVIFILRDGRTCINSKVQRTGQPLEEACERWRYSVQCYQFFRTRHFNNICVRFEDLLRAPAATLSAVCDFLKIPYRDEMLVGTENKKLPPEYRKNEFDLSKTENLDLPDDLFERIKDDLKYCGYL